MKKIISNLKENRWLHITLIVALPVIIYIQAVGFDYTNFDDNGIIKDKFAIVGNIHKIDTAFKVDAFFNATGDFYRPVQNISFMLDAQVSGNKLWMFHITNLLIHILTCISLYFFLQFLYLKRYISFLLALVFAVHPLFASGVGWVPSRGDILIGLFGILLFITFGLYFRTKKIIYFILHFFLFLITIFTKETTVLFPLFFLYYYFLVLKPEAGTQPLVEKTKFQILIGHVKKLLPFLLSWGALFVVFYLMRRKVVANTGANSDVLGIIPFFKNNQVVPTIISKFFVPINLSTLPLYDNASTIIGIIFLLAILYLTFESTIEKKWAALMGLIWFLLFAIPPTIYRLENADTFFNYLEHRTYLPMIGIVIIVGLFLDAHIKSIKANRILTWVFAPIIVIFSVLAFIHCGDYKNNFTLSMRAASQNNPSGLSMRAGNYLEKKDTLNALADINKAIELSPKDANMFFARGKIMAKLQKHEDAEQDFSLTIQLSPGMIDAYIYRSIERRYLKKYEGAFRDIYTAVKADSTNPRTYFSFGILFMTVNNYQDAIGAFTKAIQLQPAYFEAYNNRAYSKILVGDFEGAVEDCYAAMKLQPKIPNPILFNNLGRAYRELGATDSAFVYFNKAIELNKNFGQAYFERGKAWQKLNALDHACEDWKNAEINGYVDSTGLRAKLCK